LAFGRITCSPDRVGQWINQLLPIPRRVNSISRCNFKVYLLSGQMDDNSPFMHQITCEEAGISLLNNVSARGGMIKCAACAGRGWRVLAPGEGLLLPVHM
jgi:hypothetical protein